MKSYTDALFIETLKEYFKVSEKATNHLIGVEFEHFIIDEKTLRSYQYTEPGGQHDILRKMLALGWEVAFIEGDYVLGIKKEGNLITLEPGGQLEISLKAFEDFDGVYGAYNSVVSDIKSVLEAGQAIVSIGYHPKTKISELPLLPKKRYEYMYDYFKDNGAFCHNMMKGTASTQVAIDFKDEEDFIKKLKVSNFLSPVLASLFDATPVFEGKAYEDFNCRIKIWEETDIKRSKLVPGVLDRTFGYEDYAAYILSMEPILAEFEGQAKPVGNQKVSDLLKEYTFTEADILHFLSMVFPDVRVKNYLEIRMPDAMPYPYNMAVPIVIRSLFYTQDLLDKYYGYALQVDDNWVKTVNQALINAENPKVGPFEIGALKRQIIEDVMMHSTMSEKRPLMKLNSILRQYGSVKTYLLEHYKRDLKGFVEIIKL